LDCVPISPNFGKANVFPPEDPLRGTKSGKPAALRRGSEGAWQANDEPAEKFRRKLLNSPFEPPIIAAVLCEIK
jgi:hypothetical protein